MTRLLTVRIGRDEDVVSARQRARQVAEALKFDGQQQTRIATAVSEIARNVARYAGSGTVEFALDVAAQELIITIADRGPGIDPSLRERLFTPFESAKPGGLGLGLAIARDIAREFGGDLWLHSSSHQGATFLLTLRIAR